jgi:FkbM family methyltransferase
MSSPSPFVRIKSLLIATPFEEMARRLRWLTKTRHRMRHPELWGLFAEEHWITRILESRLNATSCVVDVGTHLGSFLSLVIRLAPQGKHIAFEPSPTRCPLLRRKFPNVEIFECAAGDINGHSTFIEDRKQPGYSRLFSATGPNDETYQVQVRRLDDVLANRPKIDVIKMDIQGGELAAVKGATTLIAKWRPMVIFECGQEYGAAEAGYDRRLLYEYFIGIGYEVSTPVDFYFGKGALSPEEFRKSGLYPFTAMNFIAAPQAHR